MHSRERVLAVRAHMILFIDWCHQVILPLREHRNHSLVSVVDAVLFEIEMVGIMLVPRLRGGDSRWVPRMRWGVVVVGIEGRSD
jgi:hypothetical protein